jgi:hypothetical protein
MINTLTVTLAASASFPLSRASVATIPTEYTYLLPSDVSSNVSNSWLRITTTNNASVNNVISTATNASIILYDERFASVIGSNAQLVKVAQGESGFAAEGGVWA